MGGVVGTPHPDLLMKYDSKLSLVHLNKTSLVPSDTQAYIKYEEFTKQFPVFHFSGRKSAQVKQRVYGRRHLESLTRGTNEIGRVSSFRN